LVWQLSQPNLNSFQPFQKLLIVKQPVDSIKQQVVFHLVRKTLYFKKDLKHVSFRFNKGVDENQIKEAFINGGRGHPPSHLKFFILVFSKLKEDIK